MEHDHSAALAAARDPDRRRCLRDPGLVTLPSEKAGATDRGMNKNACRGDRFPPAIIQVTVWMYARFTLSLRDKALRSPSHAKFIDLFPVFVFYR